MKIDLTAKKIAWVPPSSLGGTTVTLTLNAGKEYATGKFYFTSDTFDITIQNHSFLLTKNVVNRSDVDCPITQSSPQTNCETSPLTDVFTTNSSGNTYTTDQYSINGSGILVWDRSAVTNSLDTSEEIQVTITDSVNAKLYPKLFKFRPYYLAEIQDLNHDYADTGFNDHILKAYYGREWRRTFSIVDGPETYPGSASIPEKYITVEIAGETLQWSSGVITWYPSTTGSLTLTISYYDYDDFTANTITRNFSIQVDSETDPTCSSPSDSDLKVYVGQTFSMNILDHCSDAEGDTLDLELITPPEMTLSGSTLSLTHSTIGTQFSVQVKLTERYKLGFIYFDFSVVFQPQLCLQVDTLQTTYQQPFWTQISLCNSIKSYIYIETVSFSATLLSGWTLTQFGVLSTDSVESDMTIDLTVAISDPRYISDTYTESFSFVIVGLVPLLTTSIPLSQSKRSATADTEWKITISCPYSFENVTISMDTTDSFNLSSDNKLTWTPGEERYSSHVVKVRCEADSGVFSEYSFTLTPVNSPDTSPSCEDQSISLTREDSYEAQIVWTDIDSQLASSELTCATASNYPGFTLYKWGYYTFTEIQQPTTSDPIAITLTDGNSSVTCSINLTYTHTDDIPNLDPIDPTNCEEPDSGTCLTKTLPSLPAPFTYSLTPTDVAVLSTNVIEWTPLKKQAYSLFAVSIDGTSQSEDTLFCQGVRCIYWPQITSLDNQDGSCETSGNGLINCNVYDQSTSHVLIINGSNFGTVEPKAFVGNKACEVISYSDTEITCNMPVPTISRLNNLPVFVQEKTTSSQFYSPIQKIFSYMSFPAVSLSAPDFQPFLLVPDDVGDVFVPFAANLLFKYCSCSSGATIGVLEQQTHIRGLCKFSGLSGTAAFSLQVCCLGSCSQQSNFFKIKSSPNLVYVSGSPSEGHNHGLYTITVSYTVPTECNAIIFSFFDFYYYIPESPCSGSAQIQVPKASSADASSGYVRISYTKGLNFSSDSLSLAFSYTGLCTSGQYILDAVCTDCPEGHKCTESFPDLDSYYKTPEPCPLGQHQELTGQSECDTCPAGSQCYCMGLSSAFTCDAGFYCESGTIKRYYPCPPGHYCSPGKGTVDSNGDSGTDPLKPDYCPQDYYCLSGVYDNTSNSLDKYTPQECYVGANCPPGSTNPEGQQECESGFFCPQIAINSYDIFGDNNIHPAGKYPCPRGYQCDSSTLTSPIKCPRGTYQDEEQQRDCKECPEGHYCPWSEAESPKIANPCNRGYYCPTGSSAEAYCERQTYQDETTQSSCKTCPVSYICDDLGMADPNECPAGGYCHAEGLEIEAQCPEGYYCPSMTNMEPLALNTTTPAFDPDASERYPQPCPAGSYCPPGASTSTLCALKSYQGEIGQGDCLDCPGGYLCLTIGLTEPELCEAGYACYDSTRYSCPVGYYCEAGTSTDDPNSSETSRPYPCDAGTYCSGKNTQREPGTVTGAPSYCASGSYNDEVGQSICKECPAGHQCLDEGMTEPVPCVTGTYREEGYSPIECISCPEGTYNPSESSTSEDACINCPAGIVCKTTGISELTESNTDPCSPGYYCPEGTSRASRNTNQCPTGTFCYEGTKSLEEAQANLCPAGRYCLAGTSASAGDYEDCSNLDNCVIGVSCSPNYYCIEGTPSMISCPEGTISAKHASSLVDCYRDSESFYDVVVVETAPPYPSFDLEPLSTYKFSLDFLSQYSQARLPEDFQHSTKITFRGNGRRLNGQTERILLISHENYGTKQSIPLQYNQKDRFLTKKNMIISLTCNVPMTIDFELEFLNGAFHETYNWTNYLPQVSLMTQTTNQEPESSFFAVITKDIGSLFQDPVNLYKVFTLNDTYQLEDQVMQYENRFTLSFISADEEDDSFTNRTSEQYSSSIWESFVTYENYPVSYIPYISDCYPNFGSTMTFHELFNYDGCEIVPDPQYVKLFGWFDLIKGDSCDYSLTCDYNQDVSFLNRGSRWYEASTEENNSKVEFKDDYPPFYITRRAVSKEKAVDYTTFAKDIQEDLIPVKATRVLGNDAWIEGMVPSTVTFKAGYYFKDDGTKEILNAEMVFSNFIEGKNFNDTKYTFKIKYYALDWLESFDCDAFSFYEYIFLLLLSCAMMLGYYVANVIIAMLAGVKRIKNCSIIYVLKIIKNFYIGSSMSMFPVILGIGSFWFFIYFLGVLNSKPGSYEDKSTKMDADSTEAKEYRAGRFGICLFVLGISLLNYGCCLIVPPKHFHGFSYEIELKINEESRLNPIHKGQVLAGCLCVCFFAILFDAFGDTQVYSNYFYIIIPSLMFLCHGFSFVIMLLVKEEMNVVPVKLGLRLAIYFAIINSKTFSVFLGGVFIIEIVEFARVTWYEHIYQRHILKTMLGNMGAESNENNGYLVEISDKTQKMISKPLFFFLVAFVYLFYESTNINIMKKHVIYEGLTVLIIILTEPVKFVTSYMFRLFTCANYKCADLFETAQDNFRLRTVQWGMSDQEVLSNVNLTEYSEKLFRSGMGIQYVFAVSLTGLGMILFCLGVKLWIYSAYCPAHDYWMFLIAVSSYVLIYIFKFLCQFIGSHLIWKSNPLNAVYDKGIDGNLIKSREDYMRDAMIKAFMNNLYSDSANSQVFLSEVADDVLKIINESPNKKDIVFFISQYIKKYEFANSLDIDRIFSKQGSGLEAMTAENLGARLKEETDPYRKINYAHALKEKQGIKVGEFPSEFLYPWH